MTLSNISIHLASETSTNPWSSIVIYIFHVTCFFYTYYQADTTHNRIYRFFLNMVLRTGTFFPCRSSRHLFCNSVFVWNFRFWYRLYAASKNKIKILFRDQIIWNHSKCKIITVKVGEEIFVFLHLLYGLFRKEGPASLIFLQSLWYW